ncbi:MAG: bacillithiol biosynthesis cysteine-adding enzyme BshC [Psychroserpens sp.]|nr:bacillithiol biosynthesis cysteine-adding enzyme BshC [Psychroserpens sp.]
MPADCIAFRDTNYFSELICDYLYEADELKPFYNRFPSLKNFKAQIEEKSNQFPNEFRSILSESLQKQYYGIEISELTFQNIKALEQSNTFTVTTGHQLNLFTGPLYFFYKIISTINLCKQLKETYPDQHFVPIYWMATEDHDFDEINFFNFRGQKVHWNREASGAVGELDLNGLDLVFQAFGNQLSSTNSGTELKDLFKKAYLETNDLTQATRVLVNDLFKAYGLVIVDGNDPKLKRQFIPYIKDELFENSSFRNVSEVNKNINGLPTNYKIQVNPREINLFYIDKGIRERIVKKENTFFVKNSNITWSGKGLMEEVDQHPERFSPNVILRPLFQEVILPNLCYIGGGGELAYWLQLKSNFNYHKVVFPMLLLRNSALLISEKQSEKLQKLNVHLADLFIDQEALKKKITRQLSEIVIDFSKQRTHLKTQFEALHKLAEQTDRSFEGAVAAQEKKQLNGLDALEKRLLKAQKRKLSDHIDRVVAIQNELFPNQSLQERYLNFSEIYLELGSEMIPLLMDHLKPLKGDFTIITT